MERTEWILIPQSDEDFQFSIISKCFDHPAAALSPESMCAAYSGMQLVEAPIFCELPTSHPGRHVHSNGGHACWDFDEAGFTVDVVLRDFSFGG